jgi:hypothetical protein
LVCFWIRFFLIFLSLSSPITPEPSISAELNDLNFSLMNVNSGGDFDDDDDIVSVVENVLKNDTPNDQQVFDEKILSIILICRIYLHKKCHLILKVQLVLPLHLSTNELHLFLIHPLLLF